MKKLRSQECQGAKGFWDVKLKEFLGFTMNFQEGIWDFEGVTPSSLYSYDDSENKIVSKS